MKRSHLIRPVLCLLVSSAARGEQAALTPWESWPVRAAPADAPRTETITARQVWKIDCGADSDLLTGDLVSAAPGAGGRVLLVDAQLAQVLVIGPHGELERTVGRRGEGPGELPGAWRAVALADGRIGIADGLPSGVLNFGGRGEIVLIDAVDDPAGVWQAAGDPGSLPFCSLRDLRNANGRLLAVTQRLRTEPPLIHSCDEIAAIDPATGARTVVARLLRSSDLKSTMRESEHYEPFADDRVDVSATGRIALAPERDAWRLAIREPDGTGIVVDRPWRALKRGAAERAAAEKLYSAPPTGEILDTRPAIGRVRWRPDGHLWVEPVGVAPAAGAIACFDELDAAGTLVRRIHLVLPSARIDDRVVFMEDGRFVLLRGFGTVADGEAVRDAGAEVVMFES